MASGSRCAKGNMSDFTAVLLLMVVVLLFPLANLISFAFAYMWLDFVAGEVARTAALAENPASARESVATRYRSLSALLPLVRPRGGIESSGCELSLVITRGGRPKRAYLAGTPISRADRPGEPGNANSLYLYSLELNCRIRPLIDLSGVPLIGHTPVVGAETPVTLAKTVAVENLDGLKD